MKDLIILGNGMAGMTAALYAKRANLDFKIVGKDEYDFGQIGNAILVENYPCAASQSGYELAMNLHDQLTIENDIIIEEHTIKEVLRESDGRFSIKYADGIIDYAKTIIYALGAQHRELNCQIEKGIPIHYCALCDGLLYKHKAIAIIGGGDVAFTEAEYLSKICSSVDIVMCDENITASPSTFNRVSKIDNIYINYNFPIDKISKLPECCKREYLLQFYGTEITSHQDLQVDGIFVAIGMIPNTIPLNSSNINYILNEQNYITADENGRTSCDGFFVAGDVRTKMVRQSITAAADGANAVNSVINYLKMFK